MPYRYVEPDLFLTHNGVEVFCTYHSGGDSPSSCYWFTLDPKDADDSQSAFDARQFAGFSQTPTVGAWDDWWKPRFRTEDEAIEALVKTAIDDGRIAAAKEGTP